MNQHKQPSDLDLGRGWLNRAAEMLDGCEDHVSDAEFATAAAAIGSGFVDLASVELQAKISTASAQENARIFELQSVIAEAHEAMADRMRAEQAEIEARTAKLAELDVATLAASGLREKRAEAEARPHDDEPRGEAAYLLEGDDEVFTPEPKHAVDEGVVWVVADANGPIHSAVSQTSAQAWASDNEGDYEGLSVTALAVDRG